MYTKPALDNTHLFKASRPSGMETVLTFTLNAPSIVGSIDVIPVPFFGASLLSSGYDRFFSAANEGNTKTGGFRAKLSQILGSVKGWGGTLSSGSPLYTFTTIDPAALDNTVVDFKCVQNNMIDILELNRVELLKVKNIRLSFNTTPGNFRDGLNQILQNIHGYYSDIFGKWNHQTASIGDYFKPDSKVIDNAVTGAAFIVEIPCNYIVSGKSLLAVSVWKEIFIKSSITVSMTVEKYYQHPDCNCGI